MDRICVYCGSSAGTREEYAEAAAALGRMLAARDLALVYGGGDVGLMGVVADAALDAGADVYGIIPDVLAEHEMANERATHLEVVDSMHSRKQRMAELADGFVALPGGFGTLEETLEILTWAQLGFHRNPVGLLNVEGYFDRLVGFFDHQTSEGFVAENHREMVVVEDDAGRLLDRFAAYEPPGVKAFLSDPEQT